MRKIWTPPTRFFLQKVWKLKPSPSPFRKGGVGAWCSNYGEIHQYREHEGPSKTVKFKCSCLIASKFQTTTGAFHNLRLVNNYQILHSDVFALSILWTVYYYNSILKRVGHEVCCCDFHGFWGFHGEADDLSIYCLLDVLEVCDNKRSVLRKECEPEMCRG